MSNKKTDGVSPSELSEMLACPCCGFIQEKPFERGDKCPMCGHGQLKTYSGPIKNIGGFKFKKTN